MTTEQPDIFQLGNMKKYHLFLIFLIALCGIKSATAATIILKSSTDNTILSPFLDPSMKWVACGQGMRMQVQGFQSSTIRSNLNRTRHFCGTDFRKYRVVFRLGYDVAGPPISDVLYTGSQAVLSFQEGLEYPYTAADTGLAARQAVTWSGNNYFTYNNSGYTGPGYIVSDVMDAGQTIPANAFFGLWTTVEGPSSAANLIPWVMNGTNYIERYTGNVTSTSSQIAALGGGSDVALTSTSITHVGTPEQGFATIYTPAFILIEVPTATKVVADLGDSISYGVGEGVYGAWATATAHNLNDIVSSTVYSGGGLYINTTSSCTSGITAPNGTGTGISDGACTWNYYPGTLAPGDVMGDANSSMGYMNRYVVAQGLNYVNFGRASDRMQYLATSLNWRYRQQLLALSNATIVVSENGHNDIAASTTAATLFTYGSSVVARIRALLPSAKIYVSAITPQSTSTDLFRTTANQTTQTGWGNSSSQRGVWDNTYIRANGGLNQDGFIDPNPALEAGYIEGNTGTETSKWFVNGLNNPVTTDGIHPNSAGAALGNSSLYVSTPF